MTINAYVQGKTEILEAFTVKGYKSWTAREGVGAQATLYRDGKKIGLCTDEGRGGEVDFRADTREADKMVREFVKSLPPYQFNDMWLEQYHEEPDLAGFYWDGDTKSGLENWKLFDFANVMLEQAEEDKQLKKECRNNIIVRYEGEEDFKVFHAKWPADIQGQLVIMAQLTLQVHPNVIAEVINKRFAKKI